MVLPDEIAISGLSGRYPNCANIEEFRQALINGTDLITDDHKRWPHKGMKLPPRMGIVPDLEYFDSTFFGMNPKQAETNDPRTRKLLEVVFEAIVDAGYNPSELRGSNTGVFLAVTQSFNNYSDTKVGVGIFSRSIALMANTISFSFDFRGPSFALDTACSSSLYVISHAVAALRDGVCEMAIVCTGQTHLDPNETIEFASLGVLNYDGKCKTFDADRDGYVKSDAIVAILLQKVKNSKRIYATVVGAGTNVDGYKPDGISHPSYVTQQALLETVYETHRLDPFEVVYIEAHGTGTKVGDKEETDAITGFFCRNRRRPLLIGSVKSNAGHCETASGLVSVTKLLLAAHMGLIPANLHYNKPAPDIPGIRNGKLKVVSQNTPYEGGLLAVSAFGFGGANGHVVLRPYAERSHQKNEADYRLVLLSGRTEEAVKTLITKAIEYHASSNFLNLLDNVFYQPIENHTFRGHVVLSKQNRFEVAKCASKKRPVWFLYSGMGSQWPGMANDLMKLDVFRNTMKKCAAAVKPHGVDLENVILNGTKQTYDNIINCFTSIAAMSVCLTEVLFSLGIQPDGIIGHSLGEVSCAYADGLLTPEQATLVGYGRGYATSESNLIPGLMAAVGLSLKECEALLTDNIQIAAHNCHDNVTVSGPQNEILNFIKKLKERGVFAKIVETANIAFHSKHIAAAGPKLKKFLETVIPVPKKRTSRWLQTAIPESDWNSELAQYCSAEYQTHNYLNRVQFHQVLKHVPKDAIVIEIAPRGLLQAILRRSLDAGVSRFALVSSDASDNMEYFLGTIGNIYNAGGQPDLRSFYRQSTFPVGIDTPTISNMIKWDHSTKWSIPRYNPATSFGEQYKIDMTDDENKYIEGHRVNNNVIFPGTGYMVLAWKTLAKMLGAHFEQLPIVIENLKILQGTLLPEGQSATLGVNIFRSTGLFEICDDTKLVATGRIYTPQNIKSEFLSFPEIVPSKNKQLRLAKADFYKELQLRGYTYSGQFQGVVQCNLEGTRSTLKWANNNWITFMDTILQHIVVQEQTRLYVPIEIEKIVVDPVEHLKQRNEVGLSYNAAFRAAQSGGVELRRTHGAYIKKRSSPNKPVFQNYVFTPDIGNDDNPEALRYSLNVIMQIALENYSGALKVGVMESKFCDSSVELMKSLMMKRRITFETVSATDTKDFQCDLLITPGLTGEKNIVKYMKYSDFIFSKLTPSSENSFNTFELVTVFKHVTPVETFVLLRKRKRLPEQYTIISACNSNFKWVADLQSAINRYTDPDSRIYLYSTEYDSGLVGFFNSVTLEGSCPNLRIVIMRDKDQEPFSLRSKFYKAQLKKDLCINIFSNNAWGTYRLFPHENLAKTLVEQAGLLRINNVEGSNWRWVQQSSFSEIDQRRVSVHSVGLNFWDAEQEVSNPGVEFSGINTSGMKVMGLVSGGALSTSLVSHTQLTWDVPSHWSMEEAATVPAAYTLSYYALAIRTQLSSDDHVLIHNGASFISSAAIALALKSGSSVYVTVSSPGEKKTLEGAFPALDPSNILLSDSSFMDYVMKKTSRRGVTKVLNCQSYRMLKLCETLASKHAVFIEFDRSISLPNHSCYNLAISDIFAESETVLEKININIDNLIKTGVVASFRYKIFDKYDIELAFKNLTREDSLDKTVILIHGTAFTPGADGRILAEPRTWMDPEKCYIILGGLGGFGLELANWLLSRGASKLILNSRRDPSTGYQAFCLQKWKKQGATVYTDTSDTTTLKGAENLLNFGLSLGAIGGIFNSILLLRDAVLTDQTIKNFGEVVAAKLFSTQNLDILSRDLCRELDHFVVFSSVVTTTGNPTQSSYGYANSTIERICELRSLQGLPGLAIEWGSIADVGFVDRLKSHIKFCDTTPQTIDSCLESLDQLMQQLQPVVTSCVYTYDDDHKITGSSAAQAVLNLFGVKNIDAVEESTTLLNLGMDSLLGFEISLLLSQQFNIKRSVNQIRNITVKELKSINEDA